MVPLLKQHPRKRSMLSRRRLWYFLRNLRVVPASITAGRSGARNARRKIIHFNKTDKKLSSKLTIVKSNFNSAKLFPVSSGVCCRDPALERISGDWAGLVESVRSWTVRYTGGQKRTGGKATADEGDDSPGGGQGADHQVVEGHGSPGEDEAPINRYKKRRLSGYFGGDHPGKFKVHRSPGRVTRRPLRNVAREPPE